MKVKLEDKYKSYYTVEEYEQAKIVIAQEKEWDESTPAHWAEMALTEYSRVNPEIASMTILNAEAHTAKNKRAYNLYIDSDGNESGKMDVFIEAYAFGWKTHNHYNNAIIYIGAYLSDIWLIDGETDLAQYMHVKVFTEDR